MFFDYQFGGEFDSGFISFPDFPFASRPLSQSEICDSVILEGDSGTCTVIEGNLDPGNS